MGALVLANAGGMLGGAVFGPVGALAGEMLGGLASRTIDAALLGGRQTHAEGPRLGDLDVMASTEGAPIPRAYGRVRVPGHLIWATRLEEVASTATQTQGGKGAPRVGATATSYSYFANLAIALCEGPIAHVARIWADGRPLDLAGLTLRAYRGDETQEPDPLILAKEGEGHAPAYRGTAYVVFERLPLAVFGNRIPQFAFEVVRPVGRLERMLRAVTLIPGTTEFGYAPQGVVRLLGPGRSAPENRHVFHAGSDVEAALDEVQALCPLLERVAVVVAWFGDDLRAGSCRIVPAVDAQDKLTHGGAWSVAGLDRAHARVVSRIAGRPAYGGTPSDDSVSALIGALTARGLKVTLYPFVMMDIPPDNGLPDPWTGASGQPAYPWRGRITCDPAPGQPDSPDGSAAAQEQIAQFFHGGEGDDFNYRRMVLHYAALAAAAGGVDAFLIGSELRGLTRVRAAPGVYPAVEELIALAGEVKALLGPGTKVSYAADWTEYGAHVVDAAAQEVRFPLDPLWASPAIDMVGIDYYAPLSDWRDGADHLDRAAAARIHERAYLAANFSAGEGYDWSYADAAARAAQARTPITDGLGKPWVFRVKDLWNWWAQPHHERSGGVELTTPTAWVPQGKPIWLTELGCPAVDKGTNQPSVFPDPKSADGGVPHFSSGTRDDLIQRRALEAVLGRIDPQFGADEADNPLSPLYGGRMLDPAGVHLWTWDARPYPAFPAASAVWADAGNWECGHWLTGRLGTAPLDALVETILADCGVTAADCDALADAVEGYLVDRPMPPRAMLEPLARAYAFEAREEAGTLRFAPRGGLPVAELSEDDLVDTGRGAPCVLERTPESELPHEVSLGFTDAGADYRRAVAYSRRLVGGARRTAHAELAVVTSDAAAERRSNIWLQDLWAGRERASFVLPPSRLALTPGDVVALTVGGRRRLIEIEAIIDAEARRVEGRSIDPDVFDIPLAAVRRIAPELPVPLAPVHALLLDLPTLPGLPADALGWLAVFADPWPGPVAVWRSVDGSSFEPAGLVSLPAVIGETLDTLPAGPLYRWDRANHLHVRLHGGALAGAAEALVLAGRNAAALRNPAGDWEVMQFAEAVLVGDRTYRLAGLLRGQAGSEWAMGAPLPAGAPFVLLDAAVVPLLRGRDLIGRPLHLRLVATGRDAGDAAALALAATARTTALRPLAPVHLRARRTPSGVAISWVRRTRQDGDGWETAEVPLNEESERYEVDILAGEAVLRTLASATPSVLYAAADELADFGTPQANLTLRVAQLSATVGRGIPAQRTLTL